MTTLVSTGVNGNVQVRLYVANHLPKDYDFRKEVVEVDLALNAH